MKPFAFLLYSIWSLCLHVIPLSSLNFLLLQPASALGNESDHLALLKFKESISDDPYDILASWNSSTHFCNWRGISCSHRHSQRITSLILEDCSLYGSISPHIGNLTFLRILSLQNNSFYGVIPQELGRLFRLQQLKLTNNTLVGEIPSNMTGCTELMLLRVRGNSLSDKIPMEIGSLHKLQVLALSRNNLTGKIPASIWNLSSLSYFFAASNNLEGNIPEEIGHLNLQTFVLQENQLDGMLPSSLYNMSSLISFSIGGNRFSGSLPSNLFLNLLNIQDFSVYTNQLSGPIPTSITNASKLQSIDISKNSFVGQLPNLGMLQDIWWLNIAANNLGSNSSKDLEFLESLTNCTELTHFDIQINNFGGILPDSIGNFSDQLSELYLGGNQISGRIPATIGNLVNLTVLSMALNHHTGKIPTTVGRFQKMEVLSLAGNKLSGKIPTSLGNLSQLFNLFLSINMLDGNIPPSIGNCKKLQELHLSQNNLRGVIPSQIILSSLSIILNLSHNSLSGNLPIEVGKLKNINKLDVSKNHLSGDIPETIGECISLEYLNLQGNSFQGNIPSSLVSLKGLRLLDLSRNNLSGSIPTGLQSIFGLEYLNISFNMLDGEVPKEGVFKNASVLSVTGNIKLCGGILELHLLPCPKKVQRESNNHHLLLIIVVTSVVGSSLLLSSIFVMYWMRKRTTKSSSFAPPVVDQFSKVSYQSLHHATNGFSVNNLIGSGCYGTVYKGIIEPEENIVAIKVLNLQKNGAHNSFIAECNALRNIRHRNLVKILTCCSSIDYKGFEFKALVFEYMTNGSLEQWLHPGIEGANQQSSLDLCQRLNILIDVASALHYLHYGCEQCIIHCDLKPSNVLLDDDMVAHLNDFGLARILSTKSCISHEQTSTIEIKGTIGYAPPEYGMGFQVSTQGDMYSFGILMLEMFIGRRPTDENFKDFQNLHNYVKMAFPNNLIQIMDQSLVATEEARREEENIKGLTFCHPNKKKCLVSLFKIGLACSTESPRERMNIVDVMKELNLIKHSLLTDRIN